MQELRGYPNERLQVPGDIFELAKSVATRTTLARAKAVATRGVQVSYGFLGRKTRTVQVTEEVTTDYWVLLAKTAYSQLTGSRTTRSASLDEETRHEIQFCLGADASLRIMQRQRESVVWNGGRFDEMSWSAWEPRQVTDLNQFLVDFDFEGRAATGSDGWWDTTQVVGDMDSYIQRGNSTTLWRMFSKGAGLYSALTKMVKL